MCILDDIFIFSIVPLFYTLFLNVDISMGNILVFIFYILFSCFINKAMDKKYIKVYIIINILISPIFLYLSIILSIIIAEKLKINSNFIFQIIIFIPTGILLIISTKVLTKYIFHCCIDKEKKL